MFCLRPFVFLTVNGNYDLFLIAVLVLSLLR
jgi:hypothetical protein